jgi:hypothetical protein
MLIYTLSCKETWKKYFTFTILLHSVSYLPLSDLGTPCSKPMIYIFTYVTLTQKLLIICYTEFINTVITNWPLYDRWLLAGRSLWKRQRSALYCNAIDEEEIDDSDCNIMPYNNSCSICCTVHYLNVTKSELFFIKYGLNTVRVHYSWLHLHCTCILGTVV